MPNMIEPPAPRPADTEESAFFQTVYRALLGADGSADREGGETTVALGELRKASRQDQVLEASLLWMRYHGHIEHFQKDGTAGKKPSRLVRLDTVLLGASSVFSLTGAGKLFAETLLHGKSRARDAQERRSLIVGRLAPRFDAESRVFSWGCHEIKRFRQPALNQEGVLVEFQRLAWAEWILDPVPHPLGVNPKLFVHDTVNDLNRHQHLNLIRFKGVGSGRRIGWEFS